MISNKISYILIFLISAVFLVNASINAKGDKKNKKEKGISKVADQIANTYIDINNLSTLVSNIGFGDYNTNSNLEGTIYPKGSGKTCIFETGFVWGAFIAGDSIPHMGGSTYSSGLTPGPILADGQPAPDPNSDNYRIFRVRPDVYPGGPAIDLSSDAANESLILTGTTAEGLRAQYEKDWNEWPAAGTANDLGAPFTDKNGDGKYEPSIDIPGVPGADQTVYWVANDENKDVVNALYGTDPLGIEIHGTYWAYAQQGALGNMYFKKYTIINKGYQKYTLDSMFVSWWADIDNGNAGDDFVGNDTTLSLTYCYNADAVDNVYSPLPPPAVGADFFQGPIVPGAPTDSAIFNGHVIYGKKNLPMTAAYYFINSDPVLIDPPLGGDPIASTNFYRLMNGEFPLSGQPYINPVTNEPTKFVLTGDPLTRSGWIDGMLFPKGDRRQGMASGPFTMAPGDTQEVVVAQIIAGATPGVDRLSAIGLLKFYDRTAQEAYDNFFNLPTPPKPPQVQVTTLDKEIILNWGLDSAAVAATEQTVTKGYKFQGYNVYQLPNRSAGIDEAKRVATYDMIDGILKINDDYFDANSGVVGNHVVEFGGDNGVKRFISIKNDEFNSGAPLVNGIKYYFAVTAYSYNPDGVPQALENPIAIIGGANGITPQSPDPGVRYETETGNSPNVTHTGTADATAEASVVDPSKVTGHDYEIFLRHQYFYLDSDGKWKRTNYPDSIGKHLGKVGDVSPSTMSGTGVYGDQAGTIDLMMSIDLQSPEGDFIDAVKLTFPPGVVINSADPVNDCANGNVEEAQINGQSIMWGTNDSSGYGCFDGSQLLKVNVKSFTPPLTIDYTLYDDGYGVVYDVDTTHGIINATGSFQVTNIGNKFVTQNTWNVRDLTTQKLVVQNQTVYGGLDIYANTEGPGGSTGILTNTTPAPASSNPIFDGMVAAVDGSYEAPIVWNSATIHRAPGSATTFSSRSTAGLPDGIDITNYTVFGGVTTSKAVDNFGAGTNDIDQLQQDYKLIFDGVLDTTVSGSGDTLITVKSGGQMGTIFSTVSGAAGLADHPLNPNPGSTDPFLIRIPFKVWNVDQNKQVNLAFRDRLQHPTDNPFRAWNTEDRMYAVIVNSDYNETTPTPPDDNATWVIVFWSTHWHVGDTVSIVYANPLQVGKDVWRFTAPGAPTVSSDSAKMDVQHINVFPNPYYGVNTQEINKYARFVTFNHLPQTAKIRIFNLAGVLVRTIDHNGTQFERWDLNNKDGYPVGSGLYIAYIDMPSLGTTKILKLAIIQEQQVLDRF